MNYNSYKDTCLSSMAFMPATQKAYFLVHQPAAAQVVDPVSGHNSYSWEPTTWHLLFIPWWTMVSPRVMLPLLEANPTVCPIMTEWRWH